MKNKLEMKLFDCRLCKAFWEPEDILCNHKELLAMRNGKTTWVGVEENDLRMAIDRQLRSVGLIQDQGPESLLCQSAK